MVFALAGDSTITKFSCIALMYGFFRNAKT